MLARPHMRDRLHGWGGGWAGSRPSSCVGAIALRWSRRVGMDEAEFWIGRGGSPRPSVRRRRSTVETSSRAAASRSPTSSPSSLSRASTRSSTASAAWARRRWPSSMSSASGRERGECWATCDGATISRALATRLSPRSVLDPRRASASARERESGAAPKLLGRDRSPRTPSSGRSADQPAARRRDLRRRVRSLRIPMGARSSPTRSRCSPTAPCRDCRPDRRRRQRRRADPRAPLGGARPRPDPDAADVARRARADRHARASPRPA